MVLGVFRGEERLILKAVYNFTKKKRFTLHVEKLVGSKTYHRWDKPESKEVFQNKRMKPYQKNTVSIIRERERGD